MLKYKGRVGQAAIPGAGCWSKESIAVTTTGVGEYLTWTMFAKSIHEKITDFRIKNDLDGVHQTRDLSDIINFQIIECFNNLLTKSSALFHVPLEERYVGMLSVTSFCSRKDEASQEDIDLYLSYGHTTKTMCIGYMTNNDTFATSLMSRQVDGSDSEIVVRTMKFPTQQISSSTNGSEAS